jgi:hypothetical protein
MASIFINLDFRYNILVNQCRLEIQMIATKELYMDRLMLQEYRSRWQVVAAVEKVEQQSASLDQRWRQLNAILHLASRLELQSVADDDQVDAVRQRWIRLKTAYLNASEGQE